MQEGVTPRALSGLADLIAPVGEQLRPLWWMLDVNAWLIPPDWWTTAVSDETGKGLAWRDPRAIAFEQRFSHIEGDIRVAQPGFLPEFADLVSADWSLLQGMDFDPMSRPAVWQHRTRTDPWLCGAEEYHPAVSVVIRGVDAAYWEVFATDKAVISAVEQELAKAQGLRVDGLGGDHPPVHAQS